MEVRGMKSPMVKMIEGNIFDSTFIDLQEGQIVTVRRCETRVFLRF